MVLFGKEVGGLYYYFMKYNLIVGILGFLV